MGGSSKPSHDVDLDALDASWDHEPESTAPASEADDDDDRDLDALDAGWDDPRRFRTAAEKAAARKEKMRLRAERQRARETAIAQKRKQKKKRAAGVRASRTDDASDADLETREETSFEPRGASNRAQKRAEASAGLAVKEAANRPKKGAKRQDWVRMLVAVAIIVALAAFILFAARH
jgi:cobalamin biosynthesis Mg chelatase CobN